MGHIDIRRSRLEGQRVKLGSWVSGALLVVAVLAVASCSRSREGVDQERDQAPEMRLLSLAGETLDLGDYSGQVVVVDFWATWCTPCYLQADILETLHAEFENHDVQFLAVSVGEPEAVVRAFTRTRPFSYPVLVDPEDVTGVEFGVYALPTVMIVDRQGGIAYLRAGVSSEKTLRDLVRAELAS